MPTFQLTPDCFLPGVGAGYLPRGAYVCTTISSPETSATNSKTNTPMTGVKFTLRVEYAFPLGADGKFGNPDPNLAGREITVTQWYPSEGDKKHVGISMLLGVLVAHGRYTDEQAAEMLKANAAFEFGPNMCDGKRVFVLSDPPPLDAPQGDNFPETIWVSEAKFAKITSNDQPVTWPQDRKSAKRQAAIAANPGSSAGQLTTPTANVPTPRPATATPTPNTGFAAAPPTTPAAPPAAPAQWSPGQAPPPAFAAPPPGGPSNGAPAPTWPTAGTTAAPPPAARAWQ